MPHSKSARMVRNSIGSSLSTNRDQGGGPSKGGLAPTGTGFNMLSYRQSSGGGNKTLIFNFQSSHSSSNIGKRGQRNKCCKGSRPQLKMMPDTNKLENNNAVSCDASTEDCTNCGGKWSCCNNKTCSADSQNMCSGSDKYWCGDDPTTTCTTSLDCWDDGYGCCVDGSCSPYTEGEQCPAEDGPIVTDYRNGFEFPTWDNPMSIDCSSNKYMLVIGDWGSGDNVANLSMQKSVAEAMLEYVDLSGMPMAVLALGDNFYWTGLRDKSYFNKYWQDIYTNGTNDLTKIPWIVVGGNHDLGNNEQYALCPEKTPDQILYTSSSENVKKPTYQLYAHKQMNPGFGRCTGGKGGVRSDTDIYCLDICNNQVSCYYFPDFSYYYNLSDLNLQIVALCGSSVDIDGIGGSGGSTFLDVTCGKERWHKTLYDIDNENSKLVIEAANNNLNATNVLFINHYPDYDIATFIKQYNELKPNTNTTFLNLYGHTHRTEPLPTPKDGFSSWLVGGGGGCCYNGNPKDPCGDGAAADGSVGCGVGVINFEDDNNMTYGVIRITS